MSPTEPLQVDVNKRNSWDEEKQPEVLYRLPKDTVFEAGPH